MRGAELVPESEEYGISSFVYRNRRPFKPQKLYDLIIENFFLQQRTEEADMLRDPSQRNAEGEAGSAINIKEKRQVGPFSQVLRSKGFMWLATRNFNMAEWSQAGAILVISNSGPWQPSLTKDWPEEVGVSKEMAGEIGDRRNEIVFIGTFEDKDRQGVRKVLDDCLVTEAEMRILMEEGMDLMDPFASWINKNRFHADLQAMMTQTMMQGKAAMPEEMKQNLQHFANIMAQYSGKNFNVANSVPN